MLRTAYWEDRIKANPLKSGDAKPWVHRVALDSQVAGLKIGEVFSFFKKGNVWRAFFSFL
jgi:hypothetical protein